MSRPEIEFVAKLVERYAAVTVPLEVRDAVRLEVETVGNSITIWECRIAVGTTVWADGDHAFQRERLGSVASRRSATVRLGRGSLGGINSRAPGPGADRR